MVSVREPIRRRQPIERPLDVIGLELLVTVSQALLAGILLSLAAQLGGDARAYGLPLPGLLAVLGVVVGAGWLRWLVGGSGWLMASAGAATATLTGALWLLALQDATLPRIDWLVGLLAAACALYGLIAGVFLDGPHRTHWKGGVSQPRRGVPDTRATPARFSPPVQKVVDERLANVQLPQVSMPSTARLKAAIPRPTRPQTPTPEPTGDGLSVAAAVTPHPATGTQAVASVVEDPQPEAPTSTVAVAQPGPPTPDAAVVPSTTVEPAPPVERASPGSTSGAATPPATDVTELADVTPDREPASEPRPPGASATHQRSDASHGDPEATQADPEAPTQPVARDATEWPRPIEPHGSKPRPPHADDAPSS